MVAVAAHQPATVAAVIHMVAVATHMVAAAATAMATHSVALVPGVLTHMANVVMVPHMAMVIHMAIHLVDVALLASGKSINDNQNNKPLDSQTNVFVIQSFQPFIVA